MNCQCRGHGYDQEQHARPTAEHGTTSRGCHVVIVSCVPPLLGGTGTICDVSGTCNNRSVATAARLVRHQPHRVLRSQSRTPRNWCFHRARHACASATRHGGRPFQHSFRSDRASVRRADDCVLVLICIRNGPLALVEGRTRLFRLSGERRIRVSPNSAICRTSIVASVGQLALGCRCRSVCDIRASSSANPVPRGDDFC